MEPESRISSFPPIVDEESRVLVLGTMPGAESLRRQRYYAFGPNHFWRVMFALYGQDVPENYEQRVAFLHAKHIAVWDVLESCERVGSADSDIQNPRPNGIIELLETHPDIRHICLNGNGAAKFFRKFIEKGMPQGISVQVCPSTSPAYAIPFASKLEGWMILLKILS